MLKVMTNFAAGLVLALLMLVRVNAHIALWDESMYGWDPNDLNQQEPILPLERLPFNQWWFHDYIDRPPQPGKMMQLPAGGTYHGQVACNKAWTSYGGDESKKNAEYACDDDKPGSGTGAMHTTDTMGDPNPKDVKGCGLAIAYESDVSKLKPEDFTVISIAYDCPWKKNVDFHIPADLPACPEGGCHCSWGWVHSKDGGSAQMYHLGYRCDVTGATMDRPLPKPLVSRKCDFPNDVSNCTVGGKQPHYWLQAEGSNNFQGEHDPPYYNQEMGFMNGAQTDLFAAVGDAPAPDAPAPAPAPAPASSSADSPAPTAQSSSEAAAPSSSASSISSLTIGSSSLPPSASDMAIPSLSLSRVASSVSILANVQAVNSAPAPSLSATSSVAAVSSTASAAPTSSSASGKTCRRRRRRSLGIDDVKRHQARAAKIRNRTIGVRHTTAMPHA